jgi:hypothetical protein
MIRYDAGSTVMNSGWLIAAGTLLAFLAGCGGGAPAEMSATNPPDSSATAPSIATRPSNQTETVGQIAMFSVTATALYPLNYQ